MSRKEKKILAMFPQIKQCMVQLKRSPRIEEMGKLVEFERRSTRLLTQNAMAIRTPQKVVNIGRVSKSAMKPKSILIKGARRSRSKSVTFDIRDDEDNTENDLIAQAKPRSVRRSLFPESAAKNTPNKEPLSTHDDSPISIASTTTGIFIFIFIFLIIYSFLILCYFVLFIMQLFKTSQH